MAVSARTSLLRWCAALLLLGTAAAAPSGNGESGKCICFGHEFYEESVTLDAKIKESTQRANDLLKFVVDPAGELRALQERLAQMEQRAHDASELPRRVDKHHVRLGQLENTLTTLHESARNLTAELDLMSKGWNVTDFEVKASEERWRKILATLGGRAGNLEEALKQQGAVLHEETRRAAQLEEAAKDRAEELALQRQAVVGATNEVQELRDELDELYGRLESLEKTCSQATGPVEEDDSPCEGVV